MASCFIYQIVKMAVFWVFMTVSLCAQLLTRKKYKVLKQMLFYRHLQCNIYILSYICALIDVYLAKLWPHVLFTR